MINLILLLVAYYINTILKLFFDIYELRNALCNGIILFIRQIRNWGHYHGGIVSICYFAL